jgi:hypothetical protein
MIDVIGAARPRSRFGVNWRSTARDRAPARAHTWTQASTASIPPQNQTWSLGLITSPTTSVCRLYSYYVSVSDSTDGGAIIGVDATSSGRGM